VDIWTILKDYSGLIAALISAGIAIYLRIFDITINEKLESTKHENNEKLENIKSQLAEKRDKKSVFYQKNLDIMTNIWEKIQTTRGKIAIITSPLQIYPDLTYLNEFDLKEFLDTTEFSEQQKEDVKNADDKNEQYQYLLFVYQKINATNAVNNFKNYFISNRFFFSNDMKILLDEIYNMFDNAIFKIDLATSHKRTREDVEFGKMMIIANEIISQDAEKIVEKIEELIKVNFLIE